MEELKTGDHVEVYVTNWQGVAQGTKATVLNANGYEALWADLGVDVNTDPHPPERPEFQIVVLIWDEDPEGWPPGQVAFGSTLEVRKIDD
jgi:hypothetical protein